MVSVVVGVHRVKDVFHSLAVVEFSYAGERFKYSGGCRDDLSALLDGLESGLGLLRFPDTVMVRTNDIRVHRAFLEGGVGSRVHKHVLNSFDEACALYREKVDVIDRKLRYRKRRLQVGGLVS